MTFVIGQLAPWLLLTAAFAGLAGWAFAAQRAWPSQELQRHQRERLMQDLLAIGVENAEPGGVPAEVERELDALRRRAELDAARVAEMARALASARDGAQEAAGRVAELERHIERGAREVEHLVSVSENVAAPPLVEEAPLKDWRLRYFEQRVRYLENAARTSAQTAPPAEPVIPLAAPAGETPAQESPFAANAETDMLLRWRMLYLEKRVAVLQAENRGEPPQAPANVADSDEAEKWKWRARYLEARTRRLERELSGAPAPAPVQMQAALEVQPAAMEIAPEPAEPAAPAPLVPAGDEQRPPGLAAPRGGAGDDLSLIEGVSLLQHSTLNALGIHHFEQIAAWTPANIAWVDQYLRLRGRIIEEQWVEQAQDLVRDGPASGRRVMEREDV